MIGSDISEGVARYCTYGCTVYRNIQNLICRNRLHCKSLAGAIFHSHST